MSEGVVKEEPAPPEWPAGAVLKTEESPPEMPAGAMWSSTEQAVRQVATWTEVMKERRRLAAAVVKARRGLDAAVWGGASAAEQALLLQDSCGLDAGVFNQMQGSDEGRRATERERLRLKNLPRKRASALNPSHAKLQRTVAFEAWLARRPLVVGPQVFDKDALYREFMGIRKREQNRASDARRFGETTDEQRAAIRTSSPPLSLLAVEPAPPAALLPAEQCSPERGEEAGPEVREAAAAARVGPGTARLLTARILLGDTSGPCT